jgi:hypothetical protein
MTSNIIPADLIEEIGIDKLPLEEQAAVLEEIGDALMAGILARAVPLLDDASKKELDTMLDSVEEAAQLEAFLNSKIPNFQEVVAEEVTAFRGEALQFFQAL